MRWGNEVRVKEARHASGKACRGKVSGRHRLYEKGETKTYQSLDAVPERTK
jgi:hypothetical protein